MMAKTKTDMREAVMTAAKATVQSHGYNALSFRELAKEVGIKSASVHYHFPTKGDLGAALARHVRPWLPDPHEAAASTCSMSSCSSRPCS
jgi:AcrR family transcriptional regulator